MAQIGSLARPSHPPHSETEAITQGDPAGFAPTIPPATHFIFRGRTISKAEVDRLKLSCSEGREVDRCYRSMAEIEAATGEHRPPDHYSYDGRVIRDSEIERLHLSCVSLRSSNLCFDTPGEADEASQVNP